MIALKINTNTREFKPIFFFKKMDTFLKKGTETKTLLKAL